MVSLYYERPQISVTQQIELLKSEGLSFADEKRALHLLQNISLFRLKSYLKPLRRKGEKTFKTGATFEDAYTLYKFDSALRKMICSELEKIEISIRTQLSLAMSERSGIYWFADSANFRDAGKHASLLNKLGDELRRSDDDAIEHFSRTYNNAFPPSWMTFEVSSFGTLSMMYKWLKAGRARRQIANFYGISDTVMESWLHSIVYVRNICAHHSRLWNKRLSINPLVPRHLQRAFVAVPADTKRVYYILSIILYLLQTINPTNSFAARFRILLLQYPQIDIAAMGFPKDWQEQGLWGRN
ncbi:MAG: Abi family protein [Bacteroidales bacterium]|nr:Abi family protein [Bacteroidales bacterium]